MKFIFNITPAERVVILPIAGAIDQFEPIGRNRDEGSKPIRVKKAIVDQVSSNGIPIMSRFLVCLAMQAFRVRLGVIYIQQSDGRKRFNQNHLELLLGITAVAAIAIEHAASVEVLEIEKMLMEEGLDIRRDLIGNSPRMAVLKRLIKKAAAVDSTVLIQGESGTGKELVARAIHDMSPRSSRPFVAVNCGAIPENMLESELFGYEKGAFTGASTQKKGKFEMAAGGTLLLDEIGELPLAMLLHERRPVYLIQRLAGLFAPAFLENRRRFAARRRRLTTERRALKQSARLFLLNGKASAHKGRRLHLSGQWFIRKGPPLWLAAKTSLPRSRESR